MGVTPWLSLIGLGEDGPAALSPVAKALIGQAVLVAGGARHLELLGPVPAQTYAWPSPLEEGIKHVMSFRGRAVVVLASGDPFCFGIGATLMRHMAADEMRSLPQPSAFSLMVNRLGWALQDCVTLSLHGRPLEAIMPHLQPGARVLALSWDGTTAGKLAALLRARGMGESVIHVGERLGGPHERLRTLRADGLMPDDIHPLNTLALEIVAAPAARIIPLAAGLRDDAFDHDGQITKRDIRALTLGALAPRAGELLWDIGAGTGSVAIEWLLRHDSLNAIAIEREGAKAARIAHNAATLGVPRLDIVTGAAPQALAGLPTPQAIFIGGGVTRRGVVDIAMTRLAPGGRIVINAVTLEAQALCLALYKQHGGELVGLALSHADSIGGFTALRPALPIHQWRWEKP